MDGGEEQVDNVGEEGGVDCCENENEVDVGEYDGEDDGLGDDFLILDVFLAPVFVELNVVRLFKDLFLWVSERRFWTVLSP